MSQIKSVTFKAWLNGKARIFQAKEHTAHIIVALAVAGQDGITVFEINAWPLHLKACIHNLHHDYGLETIPLRETHDGTDIWHERYILLTSVEILETWEE